LERLRSGPTDQDWRRFVDLYQPLFWDWLRRLEVPTFDGEDLVQDVFAVLLRELPQFRYDPTAGSFRGWLRTILANRVRDYRRKRGQQPRQAGRDFQDELEQLADPQSPLSSVWDREHDQKVLHRLLNQIRPEFEEMTWRAFQRYVLDAVPVADVAAELSLSVGAVYIAKSRIQRRLREEARELID
jgi:RNA polymerase sigma-70 factor (ECF subfamily)